MLNRIISVKCFVSANDVIRTGQLNDQSDTGRFHFQEKFLRPWCPLDLHTVQSESWEMGTLSCRNRQVEHCHHCNHSHWLLTCKSTWVVFSSKKMTWSPNASHLWEFLANFFEWCLWRIVSWCFDAAEILRAASCCWSTHSKTFCPIVGQQATSSSRRIGFHVLFGRAAAQSNY